MASSLPSILALVPFVVASAFVSGHAATTAPIPADAPYRNPALPVDERVKDLLSRMTLEEKVAQLSQNDVGFAIADVQDRPGSTPESTAARFAGMQKRLRGTRLGIPVLTGDLGLHGLMVHGCTIYPQAIALGSTWNPALVKKMGSEMAAEAAACGFTTILAPVLDLARDPRYGRVEECYGECPTLVSRMGVAYITGLQGENAQEGLAPDKIYCMAKHFAGYSVPANGINIAPALIGEHEMRTIHLIPFEAAVREAHVMSVMPSYNSVDSVPSHANPWLLTEVLRKEWGFQGFVYSDWSGIDYLIGHRVAADIGSAGLLAFGAGVDIEAPSPRGFNSIPGAVKSGRLDESAVDVAAGRVLRAKFLTGLFDGKRPDGSAARVKQVVHCAAHIATARAIADESIILLRNERNLLPLDATKLKSIALIGPNAAQVQFGDYSPSKSNKDGVHLLGALQSRYGSKLKINHAKGCNIVGTSKAGFAEAVKAAEVSDVAVAVVVIGDTSMIFSGVGWEDPAVPAFGTVGEGFDVANPVPPGVQEDLVKAVAATGKPVIVVLLNGRPYCIPWMLDHIPAVVEAFYPGERQGDAIADILFGLVNPSGHLPVTLARSAGHIPCTYDYKAYGRGFYRSPGSPDHPGRDYVFDSPSPLRPFGFGLSYTTFAYTGLKVDTPAVAAKGGVLKFRCTVKNTGKVAGKAVPQIYWRQGSPADIAPPEKRLLRFAKVELAPGESRELVFDVPVGEFRTLTRDEKWTLPVGPAHALQLCDNAESVREQASFRITP